MKGTVKRWLPERGFGFITGDDDIEYFVHWTEIWSKAKRKNLMDGQRVEFDAAKDDKGRNKAVAVRAEEEV